jgi:ubiquitin-protein ligase E3 C
VRLFEFAGRLLGKALFEGVCLQPHFSFFVLARLLNKTPCLADLKTLDKDLCALWGAGCRGD